VRDLALPDGGGERCCGPVLVLTELRDAHVGGNEEPGALGAFECRGQGSGIPEVGDGDFSAPGLPRFSLGSVADDYPHLLSM